MADVLLGNTEPQQHTPVPGNPISGGNKVMMRYIPIALALFMVVIIVSTLLTSKISASNILSFNLFGNCTGTNGFTCNHAVMTPSGTLYMDGTLSQQELTFLTSNSAKVTGFECVRQGYSINNIYTNTIMLQPQMNFTLPCGSSVLGRSTGRGGQTYFYGTIFLIYNFTSATMGGPAELEIANLSLSTG